MIMGAVQLKIEPDHNASVFVHLPVRPGFVPNRVPFDYRLQILMDRGHLVGLPSAIGLKCMGRANLGDHSSRPTIVARSHLPVP